MLTLLRDKNFIKILIIVIALAIFYYFFSVKAKPIHTARLRTEDLIFNVNYKLKKHPVDSLEEVAIVSIEGSSFKVLNRRWPWTRDIFTLFLEKLEKYSPRLVCIDLAFMGESPDSDIDTTLAQAMKDAGNVIVAAHFTQEGRYILPEEGIRNAAATFGFINKPRDIDYRVRRTRPVMLSVKGNVIDYSFSMKAAASYFNIPFENISYEPEAHTILLKPKTGSAEFTIKTREDKTININYQARPDEFLTVPFWKIITGDLEENALRNKVIFVGTTAEIFHDIYDTPMGLMPGVLINANEALMYLTKNFTKRINPAIVLLIHLLLIIIIVVVTEKYGLIKGAIVTSGFLATGFSVSVYLLLRGQIWDFFGTCFVVMGSYIVTYAYRSIGLLIDNIVLKKEAITDGLTGLYVYRYFELKLKNEVKKAREQKLPLSLIVLDIDYFKKINDIHGHEDGNLILKELASVMGKFSRRIDTVCRYGGEEFCVILTNTGTENAAKYAENMRKTISTHDFPITGKNINLTVSMGIASLGGNVHNADELMKKSDSALYQAKQSGRNRVALAK